MTTYRERLTAPISWWLAALAFAAVWGWIMVVATTWSVAIVAFVVIAALGVYAVWRYGSLLVAVEAGRLHVGPASIDLAQVGDVEPLHREAYRHRLGIGADARAHLATRPYIGVGVLVPIDDAGDPTPYWLVSSRRPDALAAALGHTGNAPQSARETNGEAPRGEEEAV